MRFKTLPEWLAWQETLHPKAIDLGLDRVHAVFERMGLTRPAPTVITVAGTNGKGSCVAMLDAMLRAAGHTCAAYTSPHLLRYNERIVSNGIEMDDQALCKAFDRVDQARGDITLSYFEFGTLAAFDLMERARLDVALLEVGLGGRLDAVNMIDADCALITTIGVDHTDWLGPDRDSIAIEKAGIMRRDKPAVYGDHDMPDNLLAEAERIGAHHYCLGKDYDYEPANGIWSWSACRNPVVGAASAAIQRSNLPKPAMQGDHQLANAAACLMVLETLSGRLTIGDQAVKQGLTSARLPGRLQRLEIIGVEIILDVAHNPQAAASLASALAQLPKRSPQVAVYAQLRDKDHAGTVAAFETAFDHWYVAGLAGERGLPAGELAKVVKEVIPAARITSHETVSQAVARACDAAGTAGRVVVFGSFHTVEAAARVLL